MMSSPGMPATIPSWGGTGDQHESSSTNIGTDHIKDFAKGDRIDALSTASTAITPSLPATRSLILSDSFGSAAPGISATGRRGHLGPGDVNDDGKYDFNIQLDGHYSFTLAQTIL